MPGGIVSSSEATSQPEDFGQVLRKRISDLGRNPSLN